MVLYANALVVIVNVASSHVNVVFLPVNVLFAYMHAVVWLVN